LSSNNNSYGAGDLHEGFEFGWEAPTTAANIAPEKDVEGVMAGANVWPSEEDVGGFREAALRY